MNYGGDDPYRAGEGDYTLPATQPDDSFALHATWRIETQYATPSGDGGGGIRLRFRAEKVRMVLAGEGELRVRLDDGEEGVVTVSGTPRSYAVADTTGDGGVHVLDVEVSPGVDVYSFTFG